MNIKRLLLFLGCVLFPLGLWASSPWSYSGVLDGFYGHGFDSPPSSKLYPFVYSYPDNKSVGLNYAQVEVKYRSTETNGWFGNLGLHTGRYVEENYSAEPNWLRSIYSASIGKNLTSKWGVEAGVFTSHIGMESAIGKDNWTLSRSLVADNSPYFESGIKTTCVPNEKWSFTLLGLNGWQVISDPNRSKGGGTQVQWKPNASVLLNSSTYIGNEQPSGVQSKMRYFHDFFAVFKLSEKCSLAPVLDLGIQENGRGGWDSWGGGALFVFLSFAVAK